jgi:hypothetical protein
LGVNRISTVCPKCSAQIQKSIDWFRKNNELICPCGTTIYLATHELMTIIDQLEGAIGRLIRPAPTDRRYRDGGSSGREHLAAILAADVEG